MRAWKPIMLALTMILVTSSTARADEPRKIVWKDHEWHRVEPWEYALTTVLATTSASIALFVNAPTDARWSGPILFDKQARNLFRLPNDSWRSNAGIASDILYYGNSFFPLVDTLIVTWGVRGSSDAAAQEFSIDAEALAITGVASEASQRFVGRERPYVAPCRANPNGKDCNPVPSVENVSFFSGHSAMAFTGAMLTCVHHSKLHPYGSKVGDSFVCAAMVALATATSALRMMSDRHYFSDVVIGDSFGVASGYLVPALHYGMLGNRPTLFQARIVPQVDTQRVGASFVATF